MDFVVEKDRGPIPYVLSQILDSCVTGITISDPDLDDNPLVYANAAFETVTGYHRKDILGKNCRFLQGEERDQPELEEVRKAIAERRGTTVTLRNYRRNGELFYNRFTVQPLLDPEGNLVYFLGIQYDVTNQVRAEEELERLRLIAGHPRG
ncbi:MAG: PAS domain-containing protein [Halofilum sp. (in: g-proteobacteria)]|nr:PAS domain-containing protein [Halofilum sp. (in: g-proteobacteria)]